jgi:hypothetical protein
MLASIGFWEYEAVAGKMSTFVPENIPIISRRYVGFMSTFVYRPEKAGLGKSST